ncbi:toll/interleukin-1 receptor domain-containing protein [Eubacterium limosum]|uniref:toll/interleukin-1 receptor domain-containing protein n=1 Tax=Eubacterium limosum TaxID=1736 RepID=UPI0015583A66|nr:toll/interleukin-1 receptor domain-containing protein [Eubacterium limosum]
MNIYDFRDQEKYNLFVSADENAWESDSYIMPISRCLTSYTSQDIKAKFGSFDELACEKIKQYPCILAYEDSCNHNSYFGHITEMTVRNSGIKFFYKRLEEISISDLHKMTFELDIDMSRGIKELMHTHWTIKNVNLYKELIALNVLNQSITKPTVFISYSWSPKENKDRIIRLAEKLEKDNVNVLYDEKSLLPGQDIIYFMENIRNDPKIKKVLIICNSDYARKAEERKGGVGTESEIIIPEVYGNPMQNKIIPVFFEKDSEGNFCCPGYLKNKWGIDLTDENDNKGYEKLLKDIFR